LHRARDELVALKRARWLAELAQAVTEAQKLAWRLGVVEGDSEEARELYAQLEAVRVELESLRTNGWTGVRREVEPSWLETLLPGSPLRPFRNGDPAV
jgi:hypothetical protein